MGLSLITSSVVSASGVPPLYLSQVQFDEPDRRAVVDALSFQRQRGAPS
jgi:hypothetical protein